MLPFLYRTIQVFDYLAQGTVFGQKYFARLLQRLPQHPHHFSVTLESQLLAHKRCGRLQFPTSESQKDIWAAREDAVDLCRTVTAITFDQRSGLFVSC